VTETLHDGPGPKPRTLFATHYHELTDLESTLPRLRNHTVRVEERGTRSYSSTRSPPDARTVLRDPRGEARGRSRARIDARSRDPVPARGGDKASRRSRARPRGKAGPAKSLQPTLRERAECLRGFSRRSRSSCRGFGGVDDPPRRLERARSSARSGAGVPRALTDPDGGPIISAVHMIRPHPHPRRSRPRSFRSERLRGSVCCFRSRFFPRGRDAALPGRGSPPERHFRDAARRFTEGRHDRLRVERFPGHGGRQLPVTILGVLKGTVRARISSWPARAGIYSSGPESSPG